MRMLPLRHSGRRGNIPERERITRRKGIVDTVTYGGQAADYGCRDGG